MLSQWHSLLSPAPHHAMAMLAPPPPPNRTIYSPFRSPSPRSVARAAPTLSATEATVSSPSSPKKKVLVPVAMGTEEMEAVILAGVLRRAGADVTLASVEDGLEVKASCGSRLIADTHIASCTDQVFDLVALPGGMPGSVRLRDSDILQRITVRQVEEKRLYGAICAAPAVVLLPWGLHKGKKITCHPSFMGDLPTFRAVESNVQVSGELTTSRGPGTTFQFALSFVEQMFGIHAAEDVDRTLMTQMNVDLERSTEVNEVAWSVDHNPRVLIPIADGSEEMEIIILVDILRRAKINVVLASVEKSPNIVGSQGMKIVADECIRSASDSEYDLIILPGGPAGAERLHRSRILKKLLKEQKQAGRMYGGVCSSQIVLQQQGLLEDKVVTSHPSTTNQLTRRVIDGSKVVIDGNLITGKGLGTVIDFSLAIIRKFFGHGRAKGRHQFGCTIRSMHHLCARRNVNPHFLGQQEFPYCCLAGQLGRNHPLYVLGWTKFHIGKIQWWSIPLHDMICWEINDTGGIPTGKLIYRICNQRKRVNQRKCVSNVQCVWVALLEI